MKIQPSTLGLVLAAVLLGGVSLLALQQPAPDKASQLKTSEQERQVFEFTAGDVQTLSLQTPLRSLKFERDGAGQWQMLEPTKTTASAPSVEFLLDLVATGKTQRSFEVPATEREQYGLHQPLATIEVKLKDQTTHKLILGEYDFNRGNLYALADPPALPEAASGAASPGAASPGAASPTPSPNPAPQNLEILLVSPNFEQAVSRPLEEWKQTGTATKSPSPSPEGKSPVPTTGASPSPAAGAPDAEASPESGQETEPSSKSVPEAATPELEASPDPATSPEPQDNPEPEATSSPDSDPNSDPDSENTQP